MNLDDNKINFYPLSTDGLVDIEANTIILPSEEGVLQCDQDGEVYGSYNVLLDALESTQGLTGVIQVIGTLQLNSITGITTDTIPEGLVNLYYTDSRARNALSVTGCLTYDNSIGLIADTTTAISPLVKSGCAFSINQASATQNGFLSSSDFLVFSGKENVLTFSSPLIRSLNNISINQVSTTQDGYLGFTQYNSLLNNASKWTLSGNNIYNNNLTGNVGIGTPNPDSRLHVQDNLGYMKWRIPTGFSILEQSASSGAILEQKTTTGGFFTNLATDKDNFYIDKQAGNVLRINNVNDVGIGLNLTGINNKLEVLNAVGISNASGTTRLTTAGGINYIQSGISYSADSKAPLVFGSIFAGTEWARFDTSGDFGINNTTPTYKLDVGGDIRGTSLIFSGFGNYIPGCIYRDNNWGCIIRSGLNNPPIAHFSVSDFSDTHCLTINTSGYVGLRTTSPEERLQVYDIYNNTNDDRVIFGRNLMTLSNFSTAICQLKLLGNYNLSYNGVNSSTTSVKLFIGNYSNDGEIVYPIICEDENGGLDFYVRAQDLATGFEQRNYFRGQLAIGRNNFSTTTADPYRLSIRSVRQDASPLTPTYLLDFRGIDNYGIKCQSITIANRGSGIHWLADDFNSGSVVNNRNVLSLHPNGAVSVGNLNWSTYPLGVNSNTAGGSGGYGLVVANNTNNTVLMGTYVDSASPIEGQFGTITDHDLGFYLNGGTPVLTLEKIGNVRIYCKVDTYWQGMLNGVGAVTTLFHNPPGGAGGPLAVNVGNQFVVGVSDIKFKENIRDIENAREKIFKLRGRIFDWKDTATHSGTDKYDQFGFIAQEVQEVYPQNVIEINTSTKTCNSCIESANCQCEKEADRQTGKCEDCDHGCCSCEHKVEKSLTLDYSKFVPLAVEAIKDSYKELDKVNLDNKILREDLESTKFELKALKSLVQSQTIIIEAMKKALLLKGITLTI